MRRDLMAVVDRTHILRANFIVSYLHAAANKRILPAQKSRIEIERRPQTVPVKNLNQPYILRNAVVIAERDRLFLSVPHLSLIHI